MNKSTLFILTIALSLSAHARNWERVAPVPNSDVLFTHATARSVEPAPAGYVVAGTITDWPTVSTEVTGIEGETWINVAPAAYAKYDAATNLIAATDADIATHEATVTATEATVQAYKDAQYLPIVKLLDQLLSAYGLSIPTTEAEAMAHIASMPLTAEQVALIGSLSSMWETVKTLGIDADLVRILATEVIE